MPLSQALQHLLNWNLIVLAPPCPVPANPAPGYKHNASCAYHSNSPGHNTEDCGPLKHRIQDLIDEGVFEFTPDGQIELFYHPSNFEAARRIVRSDKFRKGSLKII